MGLESACDQDDNHLSIMLQRKDILNSKLFAVHVFVGSDSDLGLAEPFVWPERELQRSMFRERRRLER